MGILKDYYQVLGLPETADASQIKTRFRELARKHHPDLNPGEQNLRRFQEVSEAYEVLGDSTRKKEYDRKREWVKRLVASRPQRRATARPQSPPPFWEKALWRKISMAAGVALIWLAGLLLADHFMAKPEEPEMVSGLETRFDNLNEAHLEVITSQGVIRIAPSEADRLNPGDSIQRVVTPLFNRIVRLRVINNREMDFSPFGPMAKTLVGLGTIILLFGIVATLPVTGSWLKFRAAAIGVFLSLVAFVVVLAS